MKVKIYRFSRFYLVDFVKIRGDAASFSKTIENIMKDNEIIGLSGVAA